jgi:hypothetical protein
VASHCTPQACRRNFDITSTNKPRQSRGHAGEKPTTSTIVALPTSFPPSSLPQKPGRHNRRQSPVPLADAKLRDESPKRENDTKAPPLFDHKIKGFHWRGHDGWIHAGGVWQQNSDASRKVNDGYSHHHHWSRHKAEIGSSPSSHTTSVADHPSPAPAPPTNQPTDEEALSHRTLRRPPTDTLRRSIHRRPKTRLPNVV